MRPSWATPAAAFLVALFVPLLVARIRPTLLFFLPAMIGMMIYGWDFFLLSLAQNEQSSVSPDGPLIWPFKFIIPFAAATVLLQGFAEIARCVICLRDGVWPPRLSDVQEVDVEAAKRMLDQAEVERAEAGR